MIRWTKWKCQARYTKTFKILFSGREWMVESVTGSVKKAKLTNNQIVTSGSGNTSHSDNLRFLGKGNCRKCKYLMIWICVGLYQESRTGSTLKSLCIKGDLIYSYWVVFDNDCRHEIKRYLLLGRKVMTNLDSIFKSRDITLPTKV